MAGHLDDHPDLDSAVPVLFLYRHYIELALKALLHQIEKSPQNIDTHDLSKLWARLCATWKINPNTDSEAAAVTTIIDKWSKRDETSESFRYLTKKDKTQKGKKNRSLEVEFTNIDLSALRSHMEKVHNFLTLLDADIFYTGDADA